MNVSSRACRTCLRAGAVVLVLLAPLTLTGCGSGGSKSTVSGKVVYKGTGVTGGNINLHPAAGGIAIPIFLKPDGTFTSSDVPPGEYKVSIETFGASGTGGVKMPGDMKPPEGKTAAPPMPGQAAKPVQIPSVYAKPETSGLTWTVTKGKNPDKSFDLVGELP